MQHCPLKRTDQVKQLRQVTEKCASRSNRPWEQQPYICLNTQNTHPHWNTSGPCGHEPPPPQRHWSCQSKFTENIHKTQKCSLFYGFLGHLQWRLRFKRKEQISLNQSHDTRRRINCFMIRKLKLREIRSWASDYATESSKETNICILVAIQIYILLNVCPDCFITDVFHTFLLLMNKCWWILNISFNQK